MLQATKKPPRRTAWRGWENRVGQEAMSDEIRIAIVTFSTSVIVGLWGYIKPHWPAFERKTDQAAMKFERWVVSIFRTTRQQRGDGYRNRLPAPTDKP